MEVQHKVIHLVFSPFLRFFSLFHSFTCSSSFSSTTERRDHPTTIREELPLVDQPKVTLHDDVPYVEPKPYTIPLSESSFAAGPGGGGGGGGATLNGGHCNHMGGGDVIGDVVPGGGSSERTLVVGAAGIPTCVLNGGGGGGEEGGLQEDGESGTGTETAN